MCGKILELLKVRSNASDNASGNDSGNTSDNASSNTKGQKLELPPLKLEPLTPRYDEDRHRVYFEAICSGVENPCVRNIGLSGAYGTGKSSVLQKVVEHYSSRVVEISLLTFRSNAKVGEAETSNDKKSEESLEMTNAIQKEIVKQLLYSEPPHKLRGSRFRRIESFHWGRESFGAFLVAILLMIPMTLAKNDESLVAVLATDLGLKPNGWSLLAAGVGTAFALWLGFRWLTYDRLKFSKVSAGGNTISLDEKDTTYFDKYLDEITHFFNATNRDILVIEDIDRFGDPVIFENLRALNTLLNSGRRRAPKWCCWKRGNDPIRFIYAVKDDIFEDENGTSSAEARTKFFDLIVPMVPFLTRRSSEDELSTVLESAALKVGLKTEEETEYFDKGLIFMVSHYVKDKRVIQNIGNEFLVFYRVLFCEGTSDVRLDLNKLLAMVAYKNLYPADFQKIASGESRFDAFYSHAWRTVEESGLWLDEVPASGSDVFVKQLMLGGHIDRYYLLYGSVISRRSSEAIAFLVNRVRDGVIDYHFDISEESIEMVLRLSSTSQRRSSSFHNFKIMDFLLSYRLNDAGQILNHWSAECYESKGFMTAYVVDRWKNFELVARLTAIVSKNSSQVFLWLTRLSASDLKSGESEEALNKKIIALFDVALANLAGRMRYVLDDTVGEFLRARLDEFDVLQSEESADRAKLIASLMKLAKVEAPSLAGFSPPISEAFIEARVYLPTAENIDLALGRGGDVEASLDEIYEQNEGVFQHVILQLDTYLGSMNSGAVDAEDGLLIKSSARFEEVVADVANVANDRWLTCVLERSAKDCMWSNVESVDARLREHLALTCRVRPTVHNLLSYFDDEHEPVRNALHSMLVSLDGIVDVDDVEENTRVDLAGKILEMPSLSAATRVRLVKGLKLDAELSADIVPKAKGGLYGLLLKARLVTPESEIFRDVESMDWATQESIIDASGEILNKFSIGKLEELLKQIVRSERIQVQRKKAALGIFRRSLTLDSTPGRQRLLEELSKEVEDEEKRQVLENIQRQWRALAPRLAELRGLEVLQSTQKQDLESIGKWVANLPDAGIPLASGKLAELVKVHEHANRVFRSIDPNVRSMLFFGKQPRFDPNKK